MAGSDAVGGLFGGPLALDVQSPEDSLDCRELVRDFTDPKLMALIEEC